MRECRSVAGDGVIRPAISLTAGRADLKVIYRQAS
jgi:hypothetical protein